MKLYFLTTNFRLSLLVIFSVLLNTGCRSVGEITHRLDKYGPPVLKSSDIEGEIVVKEYTLNDKPFRKDTLFRGKLIKRITFHADGTVYFINRYHNGLLQEKRMFYKSGSLRALSKYKGDPPLKEFYEVYNENGSIKFKNKQDDFDKPGDI